MGDLLIKIGDVGPDPEMRDGDIVSAFSDNQTLCINASTICHVRHCYCNDDGLRPTGSLAECYQQHTNRYRYERATTNTLERTDLVTGNLSAISEIPNEAGEYCHVSEYLARRIKHPHHWIFGFAGKEIFYGGARPGLTRDIASLWDDIENISPHLRTDNKRYPYRNELRSCLAICCNDLTEVQCCDALEVDYGDAQPHDLDDNGNPVECHCCRSHTVAWRDLSLAPEADILDQRISIDVRDQPQVFSDICRLKGPR